MLKDSLKFPDLLKERRHTEESQKIVPVEVDKKISSQQSEMWKTRAKSKSPEHVANFFKTTSKDRSTRILTTSPPKLFEKRNTVTK